LAENLDAELTRELLRMIAHDLRNPLAALQSNVAFVSQMLESSEPREGNTTDLVEALVDAQLSCQSVTNIIDSLELVSDALYSSSTPSEEVFSFSTSLRGALQDAQPVAKSHEVNLVFSGSESKARVRSRRVPLQRALGYLIRNSLQHAPPGTTVTVTVASEAGMVRVSIEDRGFPIDPDLREAVFTARGQVDSKSLPGGRYSRGLGLFSARVSADLARARIRTEVASSDGGNRFTLELPEV
jgi:signal transduction histidine kinase